MDKTNQFNWVEFYMELARKLLAYKDNRQELVKKVKRIFIDTGINMPTLEKDNQLIDIDPLTVFGFFNKRSVKVARRIKLITAVKNLFDIVETIPNIFCKYPCFE